MPWRRHLIEATTKEAAQRGEGISVIACWARAALNNGIGNYQQAMTAAQHATDQKGTLGPPPWALVELIEAAVRSGNDRRGGRMPLHRLTEQTSATGTGWALGVEARSRALLSDGEAAEQSLSRVDRAPRPNPRPRRARPRTPALRRMASTRTPTYRCARTIAHGSPIIRGDGHDGVCRPGPARVARHR